MQQMQPRVLVIENDDIAPLDLVTDWLTQAGLQVDIVRPHAGELLPSSIPAGYAAVLALGGRMGAHDDEEFSWLTTERGLMKDLIAQDFPFVGICLGAQVLATAIDGKSIRTPQPEAGIVQLEISELASQDKLFGHLAGNKVPATSWHQDYIVDLPDDAVVLASSPECPVHAFRIGSNVYGLQFHPEASIETSTRWATPKDNVLAKLNLSPESVVAEMQNRQDELVQTWQPVFTRWAESVKAQYLTER